jgi:uncharacterized Zn ribbon protein
MCVHDIPVCNECNRFDDLQGGLCPSCRTSWQEFYSQPEDEADHQCVDCKEWFTQDEVSYSGAVRCDDCAYANDMAYMREF